MQRPLTIHSSRPAAPAAQFSRWLSTMRPLQILASLLIVISLVGHGTAECGRPPENAREYIRDHVVHHFNSDPPSQEKDELALWESPAGDRRFSLCAVGSNYHTCLVHGRRKDVSPGTLEF